MLGGHPLRPRRDGDPRHAVRRRDEEGRAHPHDVRANGRHPSIRLIGAAAAQTRPPTPHRPPYALIQVQDAAGGAAPAPLVGERGPRRLAHPLLRPLGHRQDHPLRRPSALAHRRRRARVDEDGRVQRRGRLLRQVRVPLRREGARDLRRRRLRRRRRERRHGRRYDHTTPPNLRVNTAAPPPAAPLTPLPALPLCRLAPRRLRRPLRHREHAVRVPAPGDPERQAAGNRLAPDQRRPPHVRRLRRPPARLEAHSRAGARSLTARPTRLPPAPPPAAPPPPRRRRAAPPPPSSPLR